MVITLGSWLVPALITVALLLTVRLFGPRMQPQNGSMFPDMGGALIEALAYLAALIVSLLAWLIWALL
jgi:hypothetical protein